MKKNSDVGLKTIPRVIQPYFGTLPELARARGGAPFYPQRDLWELREGANGVKLDFHNLPELEHEFKQAFKSAVLWYAQNQSTWHTRNMFTHSKYLFQF